MLVKRKLKDSFRTCSRYGFLIKDLSEQTFRYACYKLIVDDIFFNERRPDIDKVQAINRSKFINYESLIEN